MKSKKSKLPTVMKDPRADFFAAVSTRRASLAREVALPLPPKQSDEEEELIACAINGSNILKISVDKGIEGLQLNGNSQSLFAEDLTDLPQKEVLKGLWTGLANTQGEAGTIEQLYDDTPSVFRTDDLDTFST